MRVDVFGAHQRDVVSIRARHCWRAMRGLMLITASSAVFQSAPAIAGGRCICDRRLNQQMKGFNPRPPLLAGDASLDKSQVIVMGFQSAPAIAGGRCLHRSWCPLCRFCFNPRPPLLAGDAGSEGVNRALPLGFNPRPPLLAGDASTSAMMLAALHCFNPRPPLLAGDAD